jgi:hypothetical protein
VIDGRGRRRPPRALLLLLLLLAAAAEGDALIADDSKSALLIPAVTDSLRDATSALGERAKRKSEEKKKKKLSSLTTTLLSRAMASSNPPPSPEAGARGAVAADDVETVEDASAVAPVSDTTASNGAHEPREQEALPPLTTTAPPPPPPQPRPPQPLPPSSRPLLPPSTYGTVFTNAKSGMDAVDFDRVKKVVYEASVNSAHGAHQAKRDAQLSARVEALREKALHLRRLEPGAVAAAERSADALASRLMHARDRGRAWVCLDMDAFFFSVEARDDPERLLCANPPRPFAVGSTSMIATANGEARKFGVRSAMPGYIALR